MTPTTMNFQPPTDDEIAHCAYQLWEAEGCVHGRDMDYWLQAEAQLQATRQHDAGLLKPIDSKPPGNPIAIGAASDSTPKAAKRRQPRAGREQIYT